MTQTTPALPAAPQGVPAWLIRLASLLLVIAGPALAVWDPGGKLNSGAVQAAIILGFLVVAFIIFTVHLVLAAVHEYGWSKKAAVDVASEEITELRNLYPEFRQTYTDAAPALKQLPGFADLAERVGELEHKAVEVGQQVDVASLAGQVKTLLAADAAGVAPAAPAAGQPS